MSHRPPTGATTPPPAPAPVKDTIPELAPSLAESAEKSRTAAVSIKSEAAQGTKTAQAIPQAAPVIPFFSRIDVLADVVKAEAERIAGPVKVQLSQVQAERAALDRELAEAREGLAAKDKEIERVKGEARQRITALCEWASFVAFALAIASLIGGYFIKNFIAGITGFVALTIAGGLFALYAVEFDWIIYGSGGLVLAVVVGAAVWAWRTGKFSNPHLVNPTEQWAEAAERWSKGKAAEAGAILRTTAAGEAIYQNTIRPAMEAAKGGA